MYRAMSDVAVFRNVLCCETNRTKEKRAASKNCEAFHGCLNEKSAEENLES